MGARTRTSATRKTVSNPDRIHKRRYAKSCGAQNSCKKNPHIKRDAKPLYNLRIPKSAIHKTAETIPKDPPPVGQLPTGGGSLPFPNGVLCLPRRGKVSRLAVTDEASSHRASPCRPYAFPGGERCHGSAVTDEASSCRAKSAPPLCLPRWGKVSRLAVTDEASSHRA